MRECVYCHKTECYGECQPPTTAHQCPPWRCPVCCPFEPPMTEPRESTPKSVEHHPEKGCTEGLAERARAVLNEPADYPDSMAKRMSDARALVRDLLAEVERLSTHSKDWCKGFCRTCGTGCGQYCEEIHQLRSDLADADRVSELAKAECERLRGEKEHQHALKDGVEDDLQRMQDERDQLRARVNELEQELNDDVKAMLDAQERLAAAEEVLRYYAQGAPVIGYDRGEKAQAYFAKDQAPGPKEPSENG